MNFTISFSESVRSSMLIFIPRRLGELNLAFNSASKVRFRVVALVCTFRT
jgi:hypothetical protein